MRLSAFCIDPLNGPLAGSFPYKATPLRVLCLDDTRRELLLCASLSGLPVLRRLPLRDLADRWLAPPAAVEAAASVLLIGEDVREAVLVQSSGRFFVWLPDAGRLSRLSFTAAAPDKVVAAALCTLSGDVRGDEQQAALLLLVATHNGHLHSLPLNAATLHDSKAPSSPTRIRLADQIRLAAFCRISSDSVLAVLFDGSTLSFATIRSDELPTTLTAATQPISPSTTSLHAFAQFGPENLLYVVCGGAWRWETLVFLIAADGLHRRPAHDDPAAAAVSGPVAPEDRLLFSNSAFGPALGLYSAHSARIFDPTTGDLLFEEDTGHCADGAPLDQFVDSSRRLHVLHGTRYSVCDSYAARHVWAAPFPERTGFDFVLAFDILQPCPFDRGVLSREHGGDWLFLALFQHISASQVDFPPRSWQGVRAIFDRINESGASDRYRQLALFYLLLHSRQPARRQALAKHYGIPYSVQVEAEVYVCLDQGLEEQACRLIALPSFSPAIPTQLILSLQNSPELLCRAWLSSAGLRQAVLAAHGDHHRFWQPILSALLSQGLLGQFLSLSRLFQTAEGLNSAMDTLFSQVLAKPVLRSALISSVLTSDEASALQAHGEEGGEEKRKFLLDFCIGRALYRKAHTVLGDGVGDEDQLTVSRLLQMLAEEGDGQIQALFPAKIAPSKATQKTNHRPLLHPPLLPTQSPPPTAARPPSSPLAPIVRRPGSPFKMERTNSPILTSRHLPKLPSRLVENVQVSELSCASSPDQAALKNTPLDYLPRDGTALEAGSDLGEEEEEEEEGEADLYSVSTERAEDSELLSPAFDKMALVSASSPREAQSAADGRETAWMPHTPQRPAKKKQKKARSEAGETGKTLSTRKYAEKSSNVVYDRPSKRSAAPSAPKGAESSAAIRKSPRKNAAAAADTSTEGPVPREAGRATSEPKTRASRSKEGAKKRRALDRTDRAAAAVVEQEAEGTKKKAKRGKKPSAPKTLEESPARSPPPQSSRPLPAPHKDTPASTRKAAEPSTKMRKSPRKTRTD